MRDHDSKAARRGAYCALAAALALLACAQVGTDDSDELPADAPVVDETRMVLDDETGFARDAFPPTLPDQPWHRDTWTPEACLDCHGEENPDLPEMPVVRHAGMPDILLSGSCRSCHVLAPQSTDQSAGPADEASEFLPNAFPPLLSNEAWHADAWESDACLDCHGEDDTGAPPVVHAGMPAILLEARCRSCHVQAEEAGG